MISYTNHKNTYGDQYKWKKSMFHNPETLNIFTDSSLANGGRGYGAIFVNGDNVLFKDIREDSSKTNNALELSAIRLALDYVYRLASQYAYINIFSDSAYSISMLKDVVYKWTFNGNYYEDSHGQRAKNQEILLEITNILLELCLKDRIRINLMYVPAHTGDKESEIYGALEAFCRINKLQESMVDVNLVRYLCTFNNYIDREARRMSMINSRHKDIVFQDAITILPSYAQI
jgi:ribonuclease HI